MMSVSLQLKDLYERFDGLVTGKVPMTTYQAAEFKRDLRAVMARVGLMELGIANDTFDAMIQEAEPGLEIKGDDLLSVDPEKFLPPSNLAPLDMTGGLDPNVISFTKKRLDKIIAGMLARPTTDGGAS